MNNKTKKILFVITGLGMGGAENQVVNIADELVSRGHEVILSYMLQPAIVIPKSDKIKVLWLKGDKSIVGMLKAFVNLSKLINEFKPNVVHSHMYHANILARLVCIILKVPYLICTAHSSNEGGSLRMFIYRITNFLGDIFTNVSEEAVLSFEDKKAVKKGKMLVVSNGIDTNKFLFRREDRDKVRKKLELENKKVFIAIGRFHEAKDYSNLLNAFSILVINCENIHLLIVGDGELRNYIEQMIIDLSLNKNVTLLGIRKDIKALLSASDIFVLSSAWEGFGLVVAEAMACERVVVATDCGGVAQVLGECGFLVEPKNSNSLSEAMYKAYLLGCEESAKLGKLGMERVLEKYSLKNVIDKWEKIYK